VVLDRYAISWFTADSSLRGYDDVQNVRDEERSVGRKKLVRKAEPASKRGIAWPRWTGFRRKTVWDWLQLLIVPFVLAVIGFYFTSAQEYAHQLELEARRAAEARELEAQRVQNAALQTYLEGMRQLLLDKDLLASEEGSSLRAIATAQTLSSLGQMSSEGKGIALQFLYESALVQKGEPIVDLKNADLSEADLRLDTLSDANLSDANLSDANLSDANLFETDLRGANLSDANLAYATLNYATLNYAILIEADLRGANLSDINLNEAYMKGANLRNATLAYANLVEANLVEANLNGVDLRGANLSNANLAYTNLSGADLGGAEGVTRRELEESHANLERATLPDGSIYGD